MVELNGIDRNIAMEAVRVTEAAAISASRHTGRGDATAADQAAVEAMHTALKTLNIAGTVSIGEGSKDEAPRLFVGENVGNALGSKVDVALMPLEGATTLARGEPNALSIIAMAEEGQFLSTPTRLYMDKIAVGGGLPEGVIDLDRSPAENLGAVADAKGIPIRELVVCILDRPRHFELIGKLRETGAMIKLIGDGDVSSVIETTWLKGGIDVYYGIGGASQGVLAAAALACVGGQMEGRVICRNEEDRKRAYAAGIEDINKKYSVEDMAGGEVTMAVTGITGSAMLKPVSREGGTVITHSLILRSKTSTVRYLEAYHHSVRKRPGKSGNAA